MPPGVGCSSPIGGGQGTTRRRGPRPDPRDRVARPVARAVRRPVRGEAPEHRDRARSGGGGQRAQVVPKIGRRRQEMHHRAVVPYVEHPARRPGADIGGDPVHRAASGPRRRSAMPRAASETSTTVRSSTRASRRSTNQRSAADVDQATHRRRPRRHRASAVTSPARFFGTNCASLHGHRPRSSAGQSVPSHRRFTLRTSGERPIRRPSESPAGSRVTPPSRTCLDGHTAVGAAGGRRTRVLATGQRIWRRVRKHPPAQPNSPAAELPCTGGPSVAIRR